jgi:hypothetical protein
MTLVLFDLVVGQSLNTPSAKPLTHSHLIRKNVIPFGHPLGMTMFRLVWEFPRLTVTEPKKSPTHLTVRGAFCWG